MSSPRPRHSLPAAEIDQQDDPPAGESPPSPRRRKKEPRGSSHLLGWLIFLCLILYLVSEQ